MNPLACPERRQSQSVVSEVFQPENKRIIGMFNERNLAQTLTLACFDTAREWRTKTSG